MPTISLQFANPAWQDFINDEPGPEFVEWCLWFDVDTTAHPITFSDGNMSFTDINGEYHTFPAILFMDCCDIY